MSDKREAILSAALNLIAEQGFHGTPMSQIAKRAGVSAGIIYHYFENKDDLITALYVDMKRQFGEMLVREYDPSLPLREQFHRILAKSLRFYLAEPHMVVFTEQFTHSPYFSDEIEQTVFEYYAPVFQFVEQAKREQIIKDLPMMVLYTLTIGVAASLAQKQAAGLIELDDVLIEQVIDACWDSVRR